MRFQVRVATASEATVIYEVTQKAFSEYMDVLPSTPGALKETLADVERSLNDSGAVLALEDGKYPAGAARYKLLEDYFYIGRVAVLPAYRRQGVGRLLMNYLEDLARGLGNTRIQLSTRQSLPSNVAFYQSLGYTIIGSAPYAAPIKDYSLVLHKQL